MSQILIANAYTIGFVVVIFGRTDLFTEYTTLAILPVLAGRSRLRELARLWGIIYSANVAGATIFAVLIAVIGPALGVVEQGVLGAIASRLVNHPWWVILLSSTLAGWLMGLLSWLVSAGRETISQVLFVWLITSVIGFSHLHHSITGTVEVLLGIFSSPEVAVQDFAYFLLWTTLGNAAGGVIFAVLIHNSVFLGDTPKGEHAGKQSPRGDAGPRAQGTAAR